MNRTRAPIWLAALVAAMACQPATAAEPIRSTAPLLLAQAPATPPLFDEESRRLAEEMLSRLNAPKLDKVLQEKGRATPTALYDCLCSTAPRTTGVGVRYKDGACEFAGYGVWREPLPQKLESWRLCLRQTKFGDGLSVSDVFASQIGGRRPEPVDSLPDVRPPDAVKGASLELEPTPALLKSKLAEFERQCLPTPGKVENLFQASATSEFLRENVYHGAYGLIRQNEANVCEAAIASKLYLQGQAGMYPSEIAYKAMMELTFNPDDPDKVDMAENAAKLAEHFKKIAGLSPVIGVVGNASDFASIGATFIEQYNVSKGNAQARAAYEAFVASRGWPKERLASEIGTLGDAIKSRLKDIELIEREKAEAIIRLPMPPGSPFVAGTAPNNSPQWQAYRQEARRIEVASNAARNAAMMELSGAQQKLKALRDYRQGLSTKGCAALMAEWKRICEAGGRP
jgi:hypothetical protein